MTAGLAIALVGAFLVVTFAGPRLARPDGPPAPKRAAEPIVRPAWWNVADVLFAVAWVVLAAGAALQATGVLAAPGAVALRLAAALGLAVLGMAIVRWAQTTMGRMWRPDIPPVPGGHLITGGPFARVRNPNYVGMLCAALGVVVLAPSAATVAGWGLLLLSLMLVARAEEQVLRVRYGAPYVAYAARVGRFLPGVGRLRAGS